MIWKKRRPTIGRQVIIINVTLTSILLCILTAVLFYLNGKVQEETHAHNQQILNTISRNFELEKIRLAIFSSFRPSQMAICTEEPTATISEKAKLIMIRGMTRLMAARAWAPM